MRRPIYMLPPLVGFFTIVGLVIVDASSTETRQWLVFATVCMLFVLCIWYVYDSWYPIILYLPTLFFPAATLSFDIHIAYFIIFYCVIYLVIWRWQHASRFSVVRTLHVIGAFSSISILLLTYADLFTESTYLQLPVINAAIDMRVCIGILVLFMLLIFSFFRARSPAVVCAWQPPRLMPLQAGVVAHAINPLIDFANVSIHLLVSVVDFIRRLSIYSFMYLRNAIKVFVFLGKRMLALKNVIVMGFYFAWFLIVASFGYVSASCYDVFIAGMFSGDSVAGFVWFIAFGTLFSLAAYLSTKILLHKIKLPTRSLHDTEDLDRRMLEVLSVVIFSFFMSEMVWFCAEKAGWIERGNNPQSWYFVILSAVVIIPILWWVINAQNRIRSGDAEDNGKNHHNCQRREPSRVDAIKNLVIFRESDVPWCPEMVALPAGEFLMGLPEDGEKGFSGSRTPFLSMSRGESPRRVTIDSRFAIGRYPVTFDEYDHFCAATKRKKPRDAGWGRGRRPVIEVSWRDAVAYCAWLANETGKPYRLPSEAEWEYAARAGTTTRYAFGDAITPKDANYGSNVGRTTEVGAYPPNAWGIHDVHGNVWEWLDINHYGYRRLFRFKPAPSNRSAPLRGGSWFDDPSKLRSAHRYWGMPDYRHVTRGFRVARKLD